MQVKNILFDFNQIICYNIIGGSIFNTEKARVKFFYFLFCQLDKIFFYFYLTFGFRSFGWPYEKKAARVSLYTSLRAIWACFSGF